MGLCTHGCLSNMSERSTVWLEGMQEGDPSPCKSACLLQRENVWHSPCDVVGFHVVPHALADDPLPSPCCAARCFLFHNRLLRREHPHGIHRLVRHANKCVVSGSVFPDSITVVCSAKHGYVDIFCQMETHERFVIEDSDGLKESVSC